MLYELIWRNKWLTAEAHSLDDMINALQDAADDLRAMKARGVVLADTGTVCDDYAYLETSDPEVAKEFGFELPEGEEDDGPTAPQSQGGAQ